jgi:hypothetical protein
MKRPPNAASAAACTVNVLGAGLGAHIRGVLKQDGTDATQEALSSVEGTVLEVVSGVVWPTPADRELAAQTYNTTDPQGWARKVADFRGTTVDAAQQAIAILDPPFPVDHEFRLGMMAGTPRNNNPQPMRDADGNECIFKIVSLGPRWQHLGLQVGQRIGPVQLAKLIDDNFLEDRFNIGFLCMRRNLWIEGVRSGLASSDGAVDQDVHAMLELPEASRSACYDIEETPNTMRRYRLPASADVVFTPEAAKTVYDEIMLGCAPPTVWPILAQKSVSFGALKSIMQKIVRFRAKKVALPDGSVADAKVVMLAATLLCLSTKGDGYLPDLHLSVRGATSACKRLAIIAVEDSWFVFDQDRSHSLLALTALALATMRVPEYNISAEVAKVIGTLAVHLVRSKHIVAWRKDTHATGCVPVTQAKMVDSARLMRILRSFEGDMAMLETAARLAASGSLPVRAIPAKLDHPQTVPLVHMVDQHVYRGIGHMVIGLDVTMDGFDLKPRFRTIFDAVTGFNPRLATVGFAEETSPAPQVRNAQRLIASCVFQEQHARIPLAQLGLQTAVAKVQIDPSTIAQAVGPVAVRVATTRAQNLADAADSSLPTTWNLAVVLAEKETVIHQPLARDVVGRKKPQITTTARQLAIEAARDRVLPFKSAMMPAYNRAAFEGGKWVVKPKDASLPALPWSWDVPVLAEVPFLVSPAHRPLDDSAEGLRAALDAILAERISPELASNLSQADPSALENGVRDIAAQIAREAAAQRLPVHSLHLRFLSRLVGSYECVSVPLPALSGAQHEKELRPAKGDWIVYRALLLLAALVPSAIQSKSPAKLSFFVNDARVLRHVETLFKRAIAARGFAAEPVEDELQHVESFFKPQATPPVGPRPHQLAMIDQMLARDEQALTTQGHFVSLDTGLGKTLIALLYALQCVAKHKNCARIVWITKRSIADSTLAELRDKWHVRSVCKLDASPQPSFSSLLTILPIELLSGNKHSQAITDRLVSLAMSSFFVCDEVHELFGATIRNSNALQAVSVCPKMICMTATPAASPSQILAREWLKATVLFPVNTKEDVLVASALMVAGRIDLDISEEDETIQVALCQASHRAHLEALRQPAGWLRAAKIAREAISQRLATVAFEEALRDRAATPGGGVLVFCDNEAEADQITSAISRLASGAFRVARRKPGDNANVDKELGAVVTTIKDSAGYNLQRLGSIVTSVYASNAARRHQLRGRIKRIGQTRSTVRYLTLVPSNTILSLLFDRHNAVDAVNASLEELARVFVMQQQPAP